MATSELRIAENLRRETLGPIIEFTPSFGTAFALSPTATDCLRG